MNDIPEPFEDMMSRGGSRALTEASRFFMQDDKVFRSLRAITSRLNEMEIAYAVVGGMALVAHGYDRTTSDVDILVNSQGLAMIHAQLEGLGYVRPFPGSKQLRDASTGVRIEFLVTGQMPGDGKPKPVPFPEPSDVSIQIEGIMYVRLPTLVELKIASGMTNAGRLKDLADVQELIRVLKLPRVFSGQIHPYVRDKFLELWDAVAAAGDEEM